MDLFEHQVEVEVARRLREELAKAVDDPDRVIAAYAEKVRRLERENNQLQPKADFYDTVTQSDAWEEMAAAVKLIGLPGWGRNNVFKLLREREILRYNNEPYQEYVERGYFKLVEQKWENPQTGEVMISKKPVVSQRGIDFVRRLLEAEGSV